eukprot:XP_001701927.1 predicted protein [Chlamydomonas reinhardtii]
MFTRTGDPAACTQKLIFTQAGAVVHAQTTSGGLYNCDPAKWRAYLAVQRQY